MWNSQTCELSQKHVNKHLAFLKLSWDVEIIKLSKTFSKYAANYNILFLRGSLFLCQVVVAGHIHAVYTHLTQQMTTYKPGDTPVKRRGISSQNEVDINFLYFFIWEFLEENNTKKGPCPEAYRRPWKYLRWRALQ